MKKNLICVLTVAGILLTLVSSAFALSDKEYKQMMRNPFFAKADKALNQAYKNAENSLPQKLFEDLKAKQTSWIKKGIDIEADLAIRELTLDRVQAYTYVTNERAKYINGYVKDVNQGGLDVPNDDFASDLPDDFSSNSKAPAKKTAKNLLSSEAASEFLSEQLIKLDKIMPNEEIIYLDSQVEVNGEECFEFSSEFNFNETGRYAVSKSGKIYEYINENYVLVK